MSDSLPTDRKLEALERVIKAEQSVKLAEVALLAASSQYELVMGIKAGKKGGGKGAKREVANIKDQAAEVLAKAQAELEVAMLMNNALTTPTPEVRSLTIDVEMTEGSSFTFAPMQDREVDLDSVQGLGEMIEGNKEHDKKAELNEEGDGRVGQNGEQNIEAGPNSKQLEGNEVSLESKQGDNAGEGKEKGKSDDNIEESSPSGTDEEREEEKYGKDKYNKRKDLELSTDDLKLFRFLPKEEQDTQTKKGLDAIHAFLNKGTAIPDKIARMAHLDPTYLPKAAMTSRALALHFITSAKGNIQCGYHSYRNKSCYNRDGWGKPGAKIHGVQGQRRVINSRGKGKGSKEPMVIQPTVKGLAHCGCRIDDCLLEFFLSKLLAISGKIDGKPVEEHMFGCYDYQAPRARSFMHEAFWTFTGPLTFDHIYDEGLEEKKYLCSLNEFMAREYLKLFNSSLKDMNGKDAQIYTLVTTDRLLQLEEIEKEVKERMILDY